MSVECEVSPSLLPFEWGRGEGKRGILSYLSDGCESVGSGCTWIGVAAVSGNRFQDVPICIGLEKNKYCPGSIPVEGELASRVVQSSTAGVTGYWFAALSALVVWV